jgi:hypothetical protein
MIALARAHDLLTREDWSGAALDAVIRAALDPLAVGGAAARVDLSGCGAPGAVLPPGQALALAMALHELATNAAQARRPVGPGRARGRRLPGRRRWTARTSWSGSSGTARR